MSLTSCSLLMPAGSKEASPATAQSEKALVQFVARGNEPFWSIKTSADTLTWKTPENPNGTKLTAQRATSGEGVKYMGKDGDKTFMLEVVGTPCIDTMSGQSFGYSATWVYAGDSNAGCAEQVDK